MTMLTVFSTNFFLFLFSFVMGSVIYERLGRNGKQFWEATQGHLAKYGDAGLRTLALSYRKLEPAEYEQWNATFTKAKTTIGPDRDELLDQASELIERDLILVGATAVEDKLQAGVSFLSDDFINFIPEKVEVDISTWDWTFSEFFIVILP